MLKGKNVDITGGPIVRSILVYSIPLIIGTLLQVLFNAADIMVVGNMSRPEDNAVASIGATSTIIALLVNSFFGLSVGVTAVLARALGRRDSEKAKRVVSTAMLFALFIGVVIMLVFILTARALLRAMDCPKGCFDGAVIYLMIYSAGIPAMMVYNFGSGVIRTQGDTKRPFYYLAIAGVLNVLLNVILCFILNNKVAAVAIATTVSQCVGCVLTVIHIIRLDGDCRLDLKNLKISFSDLWEIIKIGAPCAINSALFSISNLQIQTELNSFGENAIAGSVASSQLESIVISVYTGFNGATVPFVGQNIGADNRKRVRQSVVWCFTFATSLTLVFSLLFYIFGRPALSIFVPDNPDAISYGLIRMKYLLVFVAVMAGYNIFISAMQAFGYSFIPMINSILTVFVFRIIWMKFIYPPLDAANRSLDNLYSCYLYSWALSFIVHFTTFMIIYTLYKKNKLPSLAEGR